ncbi:MAG: ATP synthase F0 subunit B [Blastocatellia bacterium]|nr:ATP synthase F0 subunit B [Chloracidobacterium sp.]MBL8185116.1 ATP synthase F0 subunit B [Blastocatellia bacterium]HBE83451.1 hypothetical protein [Blastocatellia bacterium]HRJ87948.1 ATP synthase F0 subunit B [Pyrinomonadaceae bacterium]HRK51874.1 ATP synthase F0 subunit B [Pyrinomonadaceae bacterium]
MFLLAFAESIQLVPDGTLFIHIALILLMIWVLNRTFFKPINAILEKRSKQKVGRGGEAEEILRNVADKQKQYEKTMLAARSESYEMIESERTKAVEERQSAISAARAETAGLIAKEKELLRDGVAEARVEIVREAQKMAEKISANILKA